MLASNARLFTAPPSLADFDRLCSQTTAPETYPLAAEIIKNVPIYDLPAYQDKIGDEAVIGKLQDEWYRILLDGPGVFVLRGMYSTTNHHQETLSTTTKTYNQIINHERTTKKEEGDHFAATPGLNDRIWNSFAKHALLNPSSFVSYYSNPWLAHVSAAWLGPAYRITAQVNVVKPGGKQQNPHRDYHLGFQDDDTCRRYPRSMHVASQFLTLQGAVAHTDMPVESGPTWLLPFSQQYPEGYLAWRVPEFQAYFEKRYVAVPLRKGDGIFFNPALFHAAGANRTPDRNRVANLLQISCAFGKTMEMIDSVPVVERCWDAILQLHESFASSDGEGGLPLEVSSLIQAIADGYPFPTNLDRRPPAPSGLAPESELDVLRRGLTEKWTRQKVMRELRQMRDDSGDDSSVRLG
jgi:ectoine hydroxylase-related dioxygenase (phytanoyl-CoA dioxygenase family)